MIDIERHKRQAEEAAAFLRAKLPFQPEVLVQLGTGLGGLAAAMTGSVSIPYAAVPHFPRSTVASHAGNLICGRLAGKPVAILQGRLHYYEGYSAREVGFPVRVLSLLGVKTAVITNAAGGLNPVWQAGAVMICRDHLNLLPDNPLRGPNVDEWGPRFPDLSQPYCPKLRGLAEQAAQRLGFSEICSGTYACIPGPSLETPAETRMLRLLGADAVGMSSVPEVLTALHGGLRVLGLSVIANVNNPDQLAPILLEDIIAAAQRTEPKLLALITEFLSSL